MVPAQEDLEKRLKSLRTMRIAALLLVLFLALPGFGGAEEGLKTGDEGKAVLNLKIRLFDLGYLKSVKDASDRFTQDTAGRVKAFQEQSGLPPTGRADPVTLEALYAPGAARAPLPEDRPSYNIDPDSVPEAPPSGLPDLTGEGFLPMGTEPFVASDRERGTWCYVSDSLRVDITRFYQAAGQLEWFEVYIKYRDGGQPFSVESRREGAALESPIKLAEREGAVVAISDDFYRYRVEHKQRTGIVVRDGEVRADRTYRQERSRIPSLEVLALFGNGEMKTFASDAYTGKEYIAMGVTDTWAFGPALVQEGEVPRYFYSKDYRSYREPRCALGYIGPGEYCALVITGRKTGSRGATFGWMAEKMQAMGAREALNLDGGGTTALVFQGELLNHSASKQTSRLVSGMIGFK